MRNHRDKTIKEASVELGIGHRRLHGHLVKAGALQRDSRLPCWRATTAWQRAGWLREREYQFYNRTTGRHQWAVKVLLTDEGMRQAAMLAQTA